MFSTKQSYKLRLYDASIDMMPYAGDAMTRDKPLFKIAIFLDLNILQKMWDNVSTHVSKVYSTILVIFVYFNKKILHIVPLKG